ncbi:MAG: hypothetical protein CUN55_05740 [Phototrophicales bacterium]|nr:MAG: hypothetical protein CUN55_05740 [Phototrophicales bacterium]
MSHAINVTADVQQALQIAQHSAEQRHSPFVGTEHLLIGCLTTDLVQKALAASGIDASTLKKAIESELGALRDEPLSAKGVSPQVTKLLERVAAQYNVVNSGYVLAAMLQEPEPYLVPILAQFPQLNVKAFREYVQRYASDGKVISIDSIGGKTKKSQQRRDNLRDVPPHLRPQRAKTSSPQNPNLPIYIGLGVLTAVLYGAMVAPAITIAIVIVVGGWVVSLVMHEFAHALVAYWGGDHTVVEKGYLTLNPLKYTHPLLSIGLPLFFLAIGGIGLPGGAVYIERHRLRSKIWNSYVSAAGPIATLICMIIFATPFWSGYVTWERYFEHQVQWSSLAFLVWLQGIAIVLNLLPIPPLDGFGIIEPFLPDDLAFQLRSFGSIGFLIIILMFWIPDNGTGFHPARTLVEQADRMSDQLGVEPWQISQGYHAFRFWD